MAILARKQFKALQLLPEFAGIDNCIEKIDAINVHLNFTCYENIVNTIRNSGDGNLSTTVSKEEMTSLGAIGATVHRDKPASISKSKILTITNTQIAKFLKHPSVSQFPNFESVTEAGKMLKSCGCSLTPEFKEVSENWKKYISEMSVEDKLKFKSLFPSYSSIEIIFSNNTKLVL